MRTPADILEKLADLRKQAITERSHYYVTSCVDEAIQEIGVLRLLVKQFGDRNHKLEIENKLLELSISKLHKNTR